MKHISMGELCGLVERTVGKKLPTARALRESGAAVVVSAKVGADGELTVYQSGFYTYRAAGCMTVYAVDRCSGYAYDGGEALDAAFFEDKEWTLCLMLAGEDRIEHNGNRREEKPRGFSLDEEGSNRGWGDGVDFTSRIEDKDMVDRMLPLLTGRQRQVVEMYFVRGLTQQQIADRLGVGQRAVSFALEAAKKKLKKGL